MLYRVVQGAWATVRAGLERRERPLPRFCVREVAAFLRCGILAHGFARVWSQDCGKDDVVAFSCKGRGCAPVGEWLYSVAFGEKGTDASPATGKVG
ncbi:MAG: transposase zinc-binding domain-containing protein [Planctomycetes bacterium]|nr:transposase zinc-binding domain-containing protein [Planctomycetota bacterium]